MNNPGCLQGEPIWLETRRARRWGNRNTGNISPSVLVPRNPLEETWVANLLRSRLPEALFWDMERTALQQRPVAFTPDNGRPFTFLQDSDASATMEQLVRHLAHYTRATEKNLVIFMHVRQQNWRAAGKRFNRNSG